MFTLKGRSSEALVPEALLANTYYPSPHLPYCKSSLIPAKSEPNDYIKDMVHKTSQKIALLKHVRWYRIPSFQVPPV